VRGSADLARALAGGFLAGEWSRRGLAASGRAVVGGRRAWLAPLVTQVLELYREAPADRPRELAGVVERLLGYLRARCRPVARPAVPTLMLTNPWRLPVLHTVDDLAGLLGLTDGELAWFADVRLLTRTAPREALRHYRSSWVRTPSGSVRVLEPPKPRLKALQRRLLAELLGLVPVHDAAHGFVPSRSVATYAAPHARRPVVVRLDLEGFFASVPAARVYGVWRAAGYPEPVAHALTGLVTTVLPRSVWDGVPEPADPALRGAHWRLGRRLAAPHLPQGAPTSPALANLAARRLDARLSALAGAWGGRYTRYADDLALSGPAGWRRGTSRLLDAVEEVARDEGFRLNPRKTGVLPAAGRQVLGGLVVNDRPRVARHEVDLLRAVLHNCAVHGPSTQDREGHPSFEAHLRGRVSWVAQTDPARGARLRAMLDAVDWSR
jgi:RNA-directed DNA polymerase